MKITVESFWQASLDDLKKGYRYEPDTEHFVCLVCGERFEKGAVYPVESRFYEAEKAAALHVAAEHGSMFDVLLQLDKKLTGLSDLQKQLLRLFYDGVSDRDIVAELNGGSASTIRNHRFMLKEKEKQAKLFLVMMELLQEKKESKASASPGARFAQRQNDSMDTDAQERDAILAKYFPDGPEGGLTEFPRKEKRKLVILGEIANRFEADRTYTEKEVNETIKSVYHDYVTIRRYLVDYGYMDRKEDGSEYWIKPAATSGNGERGGAKGRGRMKAEPVGDGHAGVFMLLNKANGKKLVESTPNMHGAWNRIRFGLQTGYGDNPQLQRDWNEYGEEQFVLEILETYEPEAGVNPTGKERRERLKEMERRHLERLQPYGDNGYNKQPKTPAGTSRKSGE
ncbi:DUF2087 domain-containing protein [Paenibacillus ginsengarvi]|uniref:DUF2087 domain-containing protein n=1 Tax=Paenibacillus ginsengarvi TaxID=400777 RepID=A0A3B0CRW5_9BACL|nr:DUF2087 domain-containing protein [Paenibacillus ginsengarvi]RKN86434.1 DUF2087 domain-containing protein [Paenibacillus ginsengarvi]